MEPGNLIFLKLPRYSKVHWDLRTTILPSYPNILSWVQRRDNSLGSTYPTQPSHIPQGVVTNYKAGLLALIWQLNMMWRVRQGKDRGLDREVQCRRGTGVSWGTGFQLSQTHHPSKPKSTLTQKAVLRHCHALKLSVCLSPRQRSSMTTLHSSQGSSNGWWIPRWSEKSVSQSMFFKKHANCLHMWKVLPLKTNRVDPELHWERAESSAISALLMCKQQPQSSWK